VNLLRCQILGFGKLAGISLPFQNGMNLVFAPNEGGKTTLQRILIALLYGQLRSDLKSQRRLEPWVDQYKPWRGADYGGILWCRLASGRELEIHRMFGREEGRVEIRAATGEEISGEYEQQKNGDILFARAHLGLPKELFESVAVIRENKAAELNSRDALRDRIANLAQSGDEELSIRRSLDELREALENIGSDRAPTKPYMQAVDLLQSLQSEREDLLKRREEFSAWIKERNNLAASISRLDQELADARKLVLASKWREADGKVRALVEMKDEIDRVRLEISGLGADLNFPAQNLDELNRLTGARDSMQKRHAEARAAIQAAAAILKQAEAERQGLAPYGNLSPGAEPEKITEWFVGYLSSSVQRDGFQKSLSNILEEKSNLNRDLSQLGPLLSTPDVDWHEKARVASEEERALSHESLAATQKISDAKAALGPARRKVIVQGVLSGGAFVVALAPLASCFAGGTAYAPSLMLSAAGLAASIFFFLHAKKAGRSAREIMSEIANLETEVSSLQKNELEIRRELDQAIRDSGYRTLEEFLGASRFAEQCRQRISEIDTRVTELEQQRDKAQQVCSRSFDLLKEGLARVGLSCSPGNLKYQINEFRGNLNRYRQVDAYFSSRAQHLEALETEEAQLRDEVITQESHIHAILSDAKADNPEGFRESCRRRQRALDLNEREASRAREFQRLNEGLTLDEWQNRLIELEELLRQSGVDMESIERLERQAAVAGKGGLLLPYQPGIEERRQEEGRIASELAAAREEHARMVERVAQAFQSHRELSEIEEDLSLAEKSVRQLSTNRAALTIALQTIKDLSRQEQEVLAPQLNGAVERRFLPLTRERYEEAKIDPEFGIWVRERGTGELRPADSLSRGTQDQLYFALRFGILDLIAGEEESCPCFLDEPFAAYDRTRLAEAFKILQEETQRRQLVLFTCREDLRDLASHQAAHIIDLPA
jgi:DNA repair exonuclease SbcCD ATPase subunit